MQFNYHIKKTVNWVLDEPGSFLHYNNSATFFRNLHARVSSVDENIPLIKLDAESLFIWLDSGDLGGLLTFTKNLKGWDHDHREIQVLSCLENSARSYGHKVPYSYLDYLGQLLRRNLQQSSKKHFMINEYFQYFWKGYEEFEDVTNFKEVVPWINSVLSGYSLSKVGEHCLKQYLTSGSLPSDEERREYSKSLSVWK